jgi:hypothetical protein
MGLNRLQSGTVQIVGKNGSRHSIQTPSTNNNLQRLELKDKQNKDESSGLPVYPVFVFQEQIQQ